ncbi:hypothetical protein M3M33_16510, partial [Loigolactobacillus coryniformis]|uniref:DUF6537 domain-containing protein n=1 Tax=Loigolactobacillus coryniformis TaxID=1610 RepID=UPI00201ACA7F
FGLLARGKHLRGTSLDVFGRTRHRRAERAELTRFEALLTEIVATLNPANYDVAVQLARLPEKIRGFDTVKDAAAAAVHL